LRGKGTHIVFLLLPTSLTLPAAAQPGFPVEKSYKAISISGFDVQNNGLSQRRPPAT
jgi:hypothetical protein